MITCDETIDVVAKSYDKQTKTIPTNFNEKNIIFEAKSFYILLIFLLITIELLIAVSIYCCLIKYRLNYELKEIDIKSCTCCYFDDIIKIEDFNLYNILINEKSYEYILVYNISYKTLIDAKPLHIRFYKKDGLIRVYDGTSYLVLFESEKHYFIYNGIRSFIIELDIL